MVEVADMDALDDLQQGLDVLFIVLSTILVLMMQAGFTLYEVRRNGI